MLSWHQQHLEVGRLDMLCKTQRQELESKADFNAFYCSTTNTKAVMLQRK